MLAIEDGVLGIRRRATRRSGSRSVLTLASSVAASLGFGGCPRRRIAAPARALRARDTRRVEHDGRAGQRGISRMRRTSCDPSTVGIRMSLITRSGCA